MKHQQLYFISHYITIHHACFMWSHTFNLAVC